jgi:RNA polymerase sigma factor (sigma-70 family)
MPELDDIELLKEFARCHSETAFAALVERHVNLVYSVALRSAGNAHAAEEITQAVFIILARKAETISVRTVLSGWLYQTTRLTAANFLRTEIRRQKREQEAYVQSLLNETQTGADVVWPQIAPLLDDALAKLGKRDRDAIVLRFFENKNLREVGTALGASEDAAKMRVNRALQKLRKFFTKRGVTFSAAAIAGAVSANSVHAAPAGLAKTISVVAMTKGAAAGGSTLTLVKGALKIMAWTKAKTAIIASVIAIMAVGITTIAIRTVKPPHEHSQITFAGYATPEASIQSTIWAASTGDLKKLSAGVTPQVMERFSNRTNGKSENEIKRDLVSWANALSDYKITKKEVMSDNEVFLHITATASTNALRNGKVILVMKKIGGEWKQAGEIR